MVNGLRCWAERKGYLVAWGPAPVLLEQVRDDLERRTRHGQAHAGEAAAGLDPTFASENLTFDYDCGGIEGGAVVVVVMPRPAHLIGFMKDGTRINVVMPPTYQRYLATFDDVRHDLSRNALPGWRLVNVSAPLKLLAARLGLVRYGRNNLTYAPGCGSYMQLLGFVTDAPLPVAPDWAPQEPALLDECAGCGICAAVCPTGAILEDRVLLKAERCLTLANEKPGEWQPHIPRDAHHCLIGCLNCQQHCPANPALPLEDAGVLFSGEETQALLAAGEHEGRAWTLIRNRLHSIGRSYDEPVIGRNVRTLFGLNYD